MSPLLSAILIITSFCFGFGLAMISLGPRPKKKPGKLIVIKDRRK